MVTLVEHFERFLGPIQVGWAADPSGIEMPFQVVRFERGSGPGTISFATLGLGRYPLTSPTSGRDIRHELLVIAPTDLASSTIPSLLHQVGNAAIRGRRALVRGDVVGPQGPLVAGSTLEALYVTAPVYFPDNMATYEGGDSHVVIAWLVPITAIEADFVARKGWDAFEDLLVERDPDLTDFGRSSMQL